VTEIEVNPTPVKVSVKPLPDTKVVQPVAVLVAVLKDDLVGCWAWSNGAVITVKKNGYAHNGFMPGPWKAVENNKYHIEWSDLVSTVSLTSDGTKMIEKSEFGEGGGRRVSGVVTDFSGSWLLDNGATTIAASDGTYSIGPLQGTWRAKSGSDKFEIVWPILDKIIVASDGDSLSGANQFGTFTATRRASCN
jgi:hypothetical protein